MTRHQHIVQLIRNMVPTPDIAAQFNLSERRIREIGTAAGIDMRSRFRRLERRRSMPRWLRWTGMWLNGESPRAIARREGVCHKSVQRGIAAYQAELGLTLTRVR